MTRIPIRVRLALAFALAMAVVLAAVGAFLYVRVGDSLLEGVDEGLETSARVLAGALDDGGTIVGSEAATAEDGFVQVVGPDGSLLETAGSVVEPAISPDDAARARDGAFSVTRSVVLGADDESHRLLVAPAGSSVLVVGAALDDREEAIQRLLAALLVVGPLALLLTSALGYLLAGAALRPVEAMRRRAAEISSDRAGLRLPLPRAHDEIRRLGETLNHMLGRLEAGLERERRFVADASHELRTPLASLHTELELAARRPRSRDELEQALASALEEVDRLVSLSENLLVLTQADEGALRLQLAHVDARDLLDSVATRYRARAGAAGRSIEVDGETGLGVLADRARLEQAIGNLVENALRHGRGLTRLEAAAANGVVRVRVSDEGDGFGPEFLPRVFERFSREDVARAEGGTGLGLAIVESIVAAHGGTVRASNTAAGGASVTLHLPADGAHRPLI